MLTWSNKIDIYKGDADNRFLLGQEGSNMLLVVGLNPSIADDNVADRTMVRVEKIAKFNNFDGFLMVNLYPQRTPIPDELDTEKNNQIFEKMSH